MAVSYRIDPLDLGAFDPDAFPEWDAHPLSSDFAARLYTVVAPGHQDRSFQVVGPKGVVLAARATSNGQEMSFYGLPMVLAVKQGLEEKERRQTIAAALDHLAALGEETGAAEAVIGAMAAQTPDAVSAALIDRLAKGEARAWIVADLRREAELIKRDVRDSYRSLLNWGERNMTLKWVDRETPDRALFDLFPKFHAEISGRERGDAYWDVYWQDILGGGSELLLGWLADGTLVSGSIVTGRGATAYYASGVYARDQFDKPLGHWPLWQAMMRAKAQGYARFDLGELADRWRANDKEVNIAFFKRGFSSGREVRMHWVMPLSR
jgi:hypothetical protein